MKAVYALYTDGRLGAAGRRQPARRRRRRRRDIIGHLVEPFEDYEFSHRDKATWLHWIAGVGGVVGLVVRRPG